MTLWRLMRRLIIRWNTPDLRILKRVSSAVGLITYGCIPKNAVEKEQAIKPSILFAGEFGIPIRDELELEIELLRRSE